MNVMRYRGVVVKYTPKERRVQIAEARDPRNGEVIEIASVQENIILAEGIAVDFIIGVGVHDSGDESVLRALDARPISAPISTNAVLRLERSSQDDREREESLLWSLVKRTNEAIQEGSDDGDGGIRHRYLQNLIKEAGELLGFEVVIEQSVSGGGSVDVSLERNGVKVACEISITTTPSHEAGNIRKCVRAGYDHVLSIATERSTLRLIKKWANRELRGEDITKVQYLLPEEIAPAN